MIKMAGELGGIHLGHLYSLISALNLAGELEWQYVNMPYREYLMSL
jgi:hypothetical protein